MNHDSFSLLMLLLFLIDTIHPYFCSLCYLFSSDLYSFHLRTFSTSVLSFCVDSPKFYNSNRSLPNRYQ